MPAPKDNRNAAKEGKGIQINFYLSSIDAAYIKQRLTRELNREPAVKEIRDFARKHARNGIYAAVKSEIPAIIV